MEGVTEESRAQSGRGQDENTPALFDDMLPTGKDATVPTVMDPGEDKTEPPPDWLEPLEDCDVEEDEEMKTGKRRGRRPKRTNNASRRRVKRNNWEDCPDLGKDWKRKLIMWRDGKSAAYYLSPTGLRFRSKVQLAKHLQVDLTCFDYKQGKFMEGVITKRKRRKVDLREDHIRSSLSSSRTATPDLDMTRTPESIPPTPQNGPRKHKRSKFVPFSHSNLTANNLEISPVQLAHISPSSQQPSPSPSLRLDLLSAQTTPLPPLAPVSPPKTPENNLIYINGPTADLTNLSLAPISQLNVDQTEGEHHGLPPIEGCANCGRKYPGMGRGKQLLCPKCRPSRKQQPHIIFRKVGQDKWVLGKAKKEISLKKKMHALGKKSHPFKSRRLMAQQEKEEQKTLKKSDEEDNEPGAGDTEDVGNVEDTGDIVDGDAGDIGSTGDDGYEYGPRKRKRRMCGRCRACLREHDCGKCDFCLDKTKFGGPNRLRQKCRYRQCQVRSRLQVGWSKYTKHPPIFLEPEQEESKGRKRGRPLGKRRRKHRPWTSNPSADDEKHDNEMEEEMWRPGRKGRRSRSRRRRFGRPRRLKDNMDVMVHPEIEDGGSGDLERDWKTPYVVYDEVRSGFYESEELYSNSYVQNGIEINLVRTSEPQPVMMQPNQFPPTQDLVYTVPALPDVSQPLASMMCNGAPFSLSHIPSPIVPLPLSHIQGFAGPLQMGNMPDKAFSPQVNELLTSNGASLRLSDFLRRNGLELVEVDTVYPQLFPPAHQEQEPAHQEQEPAHQEPEPVHQEPEADPQQEPESPPQPESLASSPAIVQTSSPEECTASSSTRDPGLLELLCSLRRTILPAHWVGVMTNGPVLQLFQCSKLSTMADTVLQIEQDFLFQISVQNQPLLPTHALYDRHPARLENVAKIVELLMDLEELNVCQGYQRFEANSQKEPLLCARAALCQLLVPQNQDCCEKCQA